MGLADVVVVSEDAGAAAALAVVGDELARVGRLRAVVAGRHATAAFTVRGLSPSAELGTTLEDDDCVLLTGSTPWGERIEARAIASARARGLWSVTFLDFWANYSARLSYPSADLFEVLPSRLAVVDERMFDEVVALGVDRDLVVITGSPALGDIIKRPTIVPDPAGPVVFLSQPIEELYGRSLGYTEATVLRAVASSVASLGRRLVVRPHPRENVDHLGAIVDQLAGACRLQQGPLEETFREAAVVTGMTTMGLVEAALRGLPTLSIQLGAAAPQELVTTRAGVTPIVLDEASLKGAIAAAGPVRIPTNCAWAPSAAGRVIALLDRQ